VTTDWVFLELADGLAETPGRKLFEPMRNTVLADDDSEVIPLDDSTFREAIALYVARPDKGWSLTDCVSFVVMSDRGLPDAPSAEHHFEPAGLRPLFRSP
jgi:predicted nucleic acid-binding protein